MLTDRYVEALHWAKAHAARHRDNRIGFSVYVSRDCHSVEYILAVPPSVAERWEDGNRLLDLHFGTWEGAPEGLTENTVRASIEQMMKRTHGDRLPIYTCGVLFDMKHATELCVEAARDGFNWARFDVEHHIEAHFEKLRQPAKAERPIKTRRAKTWNERRMAGEVIDPDASGVPIAVSDAHDAGRQLEREAIVAWLASLRPSKLWPKAQLEDVARRIAAGEHLGDEHPSATE